MKPAELEAEVVGGVGVSAAASVEPCAEEVTQQPAVHQQQPHAPEAQQQEGQTQRSTDSDRSESLWHHCGGPPQPDGEAASQPARRASAFATFAAEQEQALTQPAAEAPHLAAGAFAAASSAGGAAAVAGPVAAGAELALAGLAAA